MHAYIMMKNPNVACIRYSIACITYMVFAQKVNDIHYVDMLLSTLGIAMEIEDIH